MDVVRFTEAPRYTAPNHEAVTAKRLQGGEASSARFVLVGHSHFPDRAVVSMEAGDFDKIYVVVEGSITIKQSDGVRHELSLLDSILVPAGEARAIVNNSGGSAAIVVITPPPAS